HPEASEDLREAAEFYRERAGNALALALLDHFEHAVALLLRTSYPSGGPSQSPPRLLARPPVATRRGTTMRGKLPKHEVGSGNVFADVGLPDAELHLLKAEIVSRIDDILKERRLTQAAAARIMGISQPDVSKMLRGLFRGFSVERLLVFLAALGQDV